MRRSSKRDPEMRGRGRYPGQRHGGRSLDVIVEAEDTVAIAPEQPVRVGCQEILELNQRARPLVLQGRDQLFHEAVVTLAAHAPLEDTQVQRVGEKFFIVGPHVEHHRQAMFGCDTGARGVECELSDGNTHPIRPEIAEPEDSLAVGHHHHAHVRLGPVVQVLSDRPPIRLGHVETSGLSEDVRETPCTPVRPSACTRSA